MRSECPRLVFLDGSGDLIGAYRRWRSGRADLTQTDATFSGQVFEVARRIGARLHAIAWPGGRDRLEDGAFVIEHRPPPLPRARGALFNVAQALWAADITALAVRFRADALIMQDGPHRWLFSPLRALGVRLVAIVNCTLWPAGYPPAKNRHRALLRAEGWFFRSVADATLALSPECERQVRAAAKGPPRGLVAQFRPRYEALLAPRPDHAPARPFRILYAGRIEREKGVLDLVDVAARLDARRPGEFHWTVCGSGSADGELARAVAARNLGHRVVLRGALKRPELLREYAACDVVFVPTTLSFCEGLNRVALEAALSGRPAVVSSTTPAGELLGDAAITVPTGDLEGYAAALQRLADDPERYDAACSAAVAAGATLLDRDDSLEAVLGGVLDEMFPRPAAGTLA
jgi:glycogen synthase